MENQFHWNDIGDPSYFIKDPFRLTKALFYFLIGDQFPILHDDCWPLYMSSLVVHQRPQTFHHLSVQANKLSIF